ncbi:MAG: autotransporter-associated beta strand repeat-containing protein [Verrucomicrobiota bacterium]
MLPLSLALAVGGMSAQSAQALTWDSNNTGAGVTDGAGAWLGASQWWDGAANVPWSSGSDAVFGNGGAGGAVTLASQTAAGSITFNAFTGTYTLGTAGQVLTVNTGITMNPGAGIATFISPIILGGNVVIANNSTAALNLNATIGESVAGSGITKTGAGSLSIGNFAGTFTGTTTIENGTITASNATALGTSSTAIALGNANSISNNLSPTLQVNGNTTMARNVTVGLNNGITSGIYTIGSGNGGSAAHLNGTVTLNQNLSVTTTNGIYYLGDIGTAGNAITSGSSGTQRVTFSGGGAQYIGAVIGGGTGTISVTKMNAGTSTATTILAAANTYTGTTTVNQGTLQLSGSLSSSSALAVGGGTFAYNPGTYTNTAGLTNANVPTFTAATGNSQTLNGLTINSGFSSVTVSAGNTLNLGAITRNTGGLITFGTTGAITTSSPGTGGILGTYAYTGTGANLRYLTPGTIAAYSGGTAVADGTGVTDATGTVNYDVAAGGAVGASASANTLRYTGAVAGTITGPVTLNGLMNAGTAALTINGAVTSGSTNELVVLSNGQGITLNGALGNNGANAVALTYGGPTAGVLTLSGANTYTGATNIYAGTLTAGVASVANTSGAFGNNSAVTLANVAGAGINLNSFATQIGSLTGGGTAGGNIALGSATLTVGADNSSPAAYAGIISGTGGLAKIGTGTEIFTATSTYAGATVINGGTLTLTNGNNAGGALSGTPSITVNSGGTLVLMNQDTLGYTAGKEALVINSGGQVLNNSIGAQRNTLANTVTMTGGILGGTSTGDASGLYSFFAGAGNNAVSATSDASGTAALINASKVALQGANQNFNVTRGVATPAADLIISSQIGQLGGNYGLNKTGNGILSLTGANTYTGSTTITQGTLALGASGSIDTTSSVSLGTVGTFDVSAKGAGGYTVGTLVGSGNVVGALSVSTQLAIGNSPGTANFSDNLTLLAASTYSYELTGGAAPATGSADLGDVVGNLTLTAGSTLDLIQLGTYTAGNKFTLFAYDGVLAGNFRDINSNILMEGATFTDGGGAWEIHYADSSAGANGGSGTNYVTITAIPEPGVAALLGVVGMIGLVRRRR